MFQFYYDSSDEYQLYCILALSRQAKQTRSKVAVTEGGVGDSYVTIEMRSGRGNELSYNILLFGRELKRKNKPKKNEDEYDYDIRSLKKNEKEY